MDSWEAGVRHTIGATLPESRGGLPLVQLRFQIIQLYTPRWTDPWRCAGLPCNFPRLQAVPALSTHRCSLSLRFFSDLVARDIVLACRSFPRRLHTRSWISRKTVLNLLFWNVLDRSPIGQTEEGDEKRAAGALERVLVADCYGQVNNFRMARDACKETAWCLSSTLFVLCLAAFFCPVIYWLVRQATHAHGLLFANCAFYFQIFDLFFYLCVYALLTQGMVS